MGVPAGQLLQDVLLPRKVINEQDIFTLLQVSHAMASTVVNCCAGQLTVYCAQHPGQLMLPSQAHHHQQQARPDGVTIGRWCAKYARLVGRLAFASDCKAAAASIAAGLAAAIGVLPRTRSQTAAATAAGPLTPAAIAAITTAAGTVTRVGESPLNVLMASSVASGSILSSLAGCSKLQGLDITFSESMLASPGCFQALSSLTGLQSILLRQDKSTAPPAQPNRAQQRTSNDAISRVLSSAKRLPGVKRFQAKGISIPARSILQLPTSLLMLDLDTRGNDGPFNMAALCSVTKLSLPYVRSGDILPPVLQQLQVDELQGDVGALLLPQQLSSLQVSSMPSAAQLQQLQSVRTLKELNIITPQGKLAKDAKESTAVYNQHLTQGRADLTAAAVPLQSLPLRRLYLEAVVLPNEFIQALATYKQLSHFSVYGVLAVHVSKVVGQLQGLNQLQEVSFVQEAEIEKVALKIAGEVLAAQYFGNGDAVPEDAMEVVRGLTHECWLLSWQGTIQKLAAIPSLRCMGLSTGLSIGSTALQLSTLTQLSGLVVGNVDQDVRPQLSAKLGHLSYLEFL